MLISFPAFLIATLGTPHTRVWATRDVIVQFEDGARFLEKARERVLLKTQLRQLTKNLFYRRLKEELRKNAVMSN